MTIIMNCYGHDWECDETQQTRRCNNCKISEYYDDDEKKYKWLSTSEFMDCDIVCVDKMDWILDEVP